MPLTAKMLARKEGSVGYLIFNNPERHNAVSLDMWEAGEHYLKEFRDDKSVRLVVVTGAGGKAFVSGADISRFEKERSTKEAIDRYNVVVDRAYGLGYGFKGIKKLVDVVGPSLAKEIFYTARQFTAAEAQGMGLVNRVVPDGELEAYVQNYADTISANAPLTVDSVKYIVGQVVVEESKRDLQKCADLVSACFASRDYTEGRTAFMEKRKPKFTGS